MIEWEYKVVNMPCLFKTGAGAEKMLQEKCEQLGEKGWELVNFQCYDMASKFMLIFKRRKNE